MKSKEKFLPDKKIIFTEHQQIWYDKSVSEELIYYDIPLGFYTL